MKIVRDGKEYELTNGELFDASMAYDDMCANYDFDNCLDPKDYGVIKEEFDSMRDEIIGRYMYFWKHHDDELQMLFEKAASEVVKEHKRKGEKAKTNEAMISMLIYKDTTGWYDDEYFEDASHDNMIELEFPVRIVKKWFDKVNPFYYVEDDDGKFEFTVVDFWDWYKHYYDADDTENLFEFSVENGFTPEKPDDYLDNY